MFEICALIQDDVGSYPNLNDISATLFFYFLTYEVTAINHFYKVVFVKNKNTKT